MGDCRTSISENNISFLTGEVRTPEEMVQFLKEGAVFHTFGQILLRHCPEDELVPKLVDGLADISGEDQASASKKVQNWMKGRSLPKNRETLFQICFLLELDEYKSSKVLGSVSDTGIHYRNPGELAYAFALRTGKSYCDAVRLKERAVGIYEAEKEKACDGTPAVYTKQIMDAFAQVTEEDEFLTFIREHGKELGKIHETAYEKFTELLRCLQKPLIEGGEEGREEEEYTLGEVMEKYIQMHVPVQQRKKGSHVDEGKGTNEAQTKDLTMLQKLVKRYWPNETTLIKIRARKEDVSRKALLLIYLATEAFDESPSNASEVYYYEDLEEDADTLLEVRLEKMNLFLNAYGMNTLDPGNVFDYLIIYAMRAEEDEDARGRLERVLETLY